MSAPYGANRRATRTIHVRRDSTCAFVLRGTGKLCQRKVTDEGYCSLHARVCTYGFCKRKRYGQSEFCREHHPDKQQDAVAGPDEDTVCTKSMGTCAYRFRRSGRLCSKSTVIDSAYCAKHFKNMCVHINDDGVPCSNKRKAHEQLCLVHASVRGRAY